MQQNHPVFCFSFPFPSLFLSSQSSSRSPFLSFPFLSSILFYFTYFDSRGCFSSSSSSSFLFSFASVILNANILVTQGLKKKEAPSNQAEESETPYNDHEEQQEDPYHSFEEYAALFFLIVGLQNSDNTIRFSSLSDPLCNLLIELFEMKERSGAFRRRAVIVILQRLFGGTIERLDSPSLLHLDLEIAKNPSHSFLFLFLFAFPFLFLFLFQKSNRKRWMVVQRGKPCLLCWSFYWKLVARRKSSIIMASQDKGAKGEHERRGEKENSYSGSWIFLQHDWNC